MSPDRIVYFEEDAESATSVAIVPLVKNSEGEITGIFLGIRNEDGCLSPVGGKLENRESPEAGILREWPEETGVSFDSHLEIIPGSIPVHSVNDPNRNGYLFLATVKDETSIEELKKTKSLKFITPEDLRILLETGVFEEHPLFRQDLNIPYLGYLLDIMTVINTNDYSKCGFVNLMNQYGFSF
jgi:8-oxo-dGTP pyrophosphatase MutT (NUDIX family)